MRHKFGQNKNQTKNSIHDVSILKLTCIKKVIQVLLKFDSYINFV